MGCIRLLLICSLLVCAGALSAERQAVVVNHVSNVGESFLSGSTAAKITMSGGYSRCVLLVSDRAMMRGHVASASAGNRDVVFTCNDSGVEYYSVGGSSTRFESRFVGGLISIDAVLISSAGDRLYVSTAHPLRVSRS